MSTKSKELIITVISDNICPWCYIGKRRLEEGIKLAEIPDDVKLVIKWKPYQLDPTLPSPGVSKMDHYRKKFGPMIDRMLPSVQQAGKSYGLDIKFGGKVGNTLNSHRLVRFAEKLDETSGNTTLDTTNKVIESLFNSYFELNEDISDKDQLTIIAERAGLDKSAVQKYLDSDEDIAAITKETQAATQTVNGVPYFDFGGKKKVSGAQDPQVFANILYDLVGTK